MDQVAERIGQSKWTVYRKIASGEIRAVRLGGSTSALRVLESRVREWLGLDRDGEAA
ncbi:MAG: helix-turn-helix domain-containing protein [Actinobacteria bacterium]|nr:helix-turn-helix domain-containing protein [Actinomycetota bacterium]